MTGATDPEINLNMIAVMVYQENRLNTFLRQGQWPFLKDCNCTPEEMANAGFYWCGSETQPDLVRCFVCLKEFEDWDPDDAPRDEHKRLCPDCPFIKMGKTQDDCTVKEVMELCQISLKNLWDKKGNLMIERYAIQAAKVREELVRWAEINNFEMAD